MKEVIAVVRMNMMNRTKQALTDAGIKVEAVIDPQRPTTHKNALRGPVHYRIGIERRHGNGANSPVCTGGCR